MKVEPSSMTIPRPMSRDLYLLLLLLSLGTVFAYLSINIPHTEVYLDLRLVFVSLGFVLIRRLSLAILLPLIVSIAGFHQVSPSFAFIANFSSIVPFCLALRLLYRKLLHRLASLPLLGTLWALAIVIGYQVILYPVMWAFVGIARGTPSLPFVLGVYVQQPFWQESIVVALISALGLIIVHLHLHVRDRERYLSTILRSIGDAVIVTDREGGVELMNRVAESMTGWTLDEARGRDLPEVFRIVNAKSGEPVDNPVQRVISRGVAVGLANHTKLIARDGRSFQISDSAAPIRDENELVHGVVLVFRDMTREYELQERIRNDLQEKQVLLQEVHHRVKNNLQIISSLLNMQAEGCEDTRIRRLLEDARRRIFSMALIHNQLFQSGNLAEINFNEYTRMLFGELLTVSGRAHEIRYTIDMNNIHLPLQKAIPCGLILNELITNSLKHAFTDRSSGEIFISLRNGEDEAHVILAYRDNGCGMSKENRSSDAQSLGISLIENLSAQLDGSLQVYPVEKGVSYCITFPRL